MKTLRVCAVLAATVLCVSLISSADAGTILKLSLGNDAAPDVAFNGTVLDTIMDGNAVTTGDQNTAVEFTNFLAFIPPIAAADASFTLQGVAAVGPASLLPGSLVVQSFTGGSLALYDPSNALLLSGTLGDSVLSGSTGAAATGALFTTTFGSVTGGSLASLVEAGSLTLSMSMTDVSTAATPGFGVNVASGMLEPFQADVTLNIGAAQRAIPEPATGLLVLMGGVLLLAAKRRS